MEREDRDREREAVQQTERQPANTSRSVAKPEDTHIEPPVSSSADISLNKNPFRKNGKGHNKSHQSRDNESDRPDVITLALSSATGTRSPPDPAGREITPQLCRVERSPERNFPSCLSQDGSDPHIALDVTNGRCSVLPADPAQTSENLFHPAQAELASVDQDRHGRPSPNRRVPPHILKARNRSSHPPMKQFSQSMNDLHRLPEDGEDTGCASLPARQLSQSVHNLPEALSEDCQQRGGYPSPLRGDLYHHRSQPSLASQDEPSDMRDSLTRRNVTRHGRQDGRGRGEDQGGRRQDSSNPDSSSVCRDPGQERTSSRPKPLPRQRSQGRSQGQSGDRPRPQPRPRSRPPEEGRDAYTQDIAYQNGNRGPGSPQRRGQGHYPESPQRREQGHYPGNPQRREQGHYPESPQRRQSHFPVSPQRREQGHYPETPQRREQHHFPAHSLDRHRPDTDQQYSRPERQNPERNAFSLDRYSGARRGESEERQERDRRVPDLGRRAPSKERSDRPQALPMQDRAAQHSDNRSGYNRAERRSDAPQRYQSERDNGPQSPAHGRDHYPPHRHPRSPPHTQPNPRRRSDLRIHTQPSQQSRTEEPRSLNDSTAEGPFHPLSERGGTRPQQPQKPVRTSRPAERLAQDPRMAAQPPARRSEGKDDHEKNERRSLGRTSPTSVPAQRTPHSPCSPDGVLSVSPFSAGSLSPRSAPGRSPSSPPHAPPPLYAQHPTPTSASSPPENPGQGVDSRRHGFAGQPTEHGSASRAVHGENHGELNGDGENHGEQNSETDSGLGVTPGSGPHFPVRITPGHFGGGASGFLSLRGDGELEDDDVYV